MVQERVVRELDNPFSTGEDFAQLFEKSAATAPTEGSVVKGRVLSIANDFVTIDIGFKTEGYVSIKDFPQSEQDDLAAGQEVEVYLEKIENANSEAVVSRERAIREEAWERLEKKNTEGETVNGVIFGRVKGGFTVDLDGAVAFLPGSQVDVRPVKDVTPLMNISQPFVILKMDRKRGNIVVSRRAILEESRSAERAEAISGISEGDTLEGTVKNITDYGAFVDLGMIDGLLHVTDMSWKRVSHPSEVLNLGDKIKVKVIKFDKKTQRISLGIKQLEDSPWSGANSDYPLDSVHTGTVSNITDYGAFIELESGVEGLVHVSEMSWTKKNVHPSKIVTQGQEVQIKILAIDEQNHRLSLGIKQCQDNPWANITASHKVGDTTEGEIKSITDFGIFVGLTAEIDGLVHLSDLSWDEKPEDAVKAYKKGDKITAKILDIDVEKERVALGVKQLVKGGADEIAGFKQNDVATFAVVSVDNNGIEVEVSEGVKAYIRKGDLSHDRIECRPERFSVGDRIDAKVIGFDRAKQSLKLSIKAMEQDAQKQAIKEYGSADSGASLGDILGVALEDAKKDKAEAEDKPKKAAAKKPAAKKAPAKKADAEKTDGK